MNNRRVLMRSVRPVRMFVRGMQVESGQEKKSRGEKSKNPYAPG